MSVWSTRIEFYGYRFTDEGLKPTMGKVKAVKECKPPESREEVRSFLGMIGCLSENSSQDMQCLQLH